MAERTSRDKFITKAKYRLLSEEGISRVDQCTDSIDAGTLDVDKVVTRANTVLPDPDWTNGEKFLLGVIIMCTIYADFLSSSDAAEMPEELEAVMRLLQEMGVLDGEDG